MSSRSLLDFGGTILIVAALLGCDQVQNQSSASKQSSTPIELRHQSDSDAQMDALSEELNQQSEQWPPLTPPVDESNPIVPSANESRQRLEKAIGLAKTGDLAGAMIEMTGRRCLRMSVIAGICCGLNYPL